MRVVFMGTPEFAATILEDLSQQHEVAAVYTRPDAVRGRGRKLEPSPVKRTAERLGLPVLEPRTLRDEAVQVELASFEPDVICVAAYGAILPKAVLDLPPFGCLNVHASLLPRWRGAAPVERAILAGDAVAGVCIMRMEEGLDTGAYCVCRTARIDGKTAPELTDELANLGSHALLTALVHVQSGAAEWTEQDESLVTYAHKIEKAEMRLDPADGALANVRRVLASTDAAPARCEVAGKGVRLMRAMTCDDALAAGEVLVSHGRVALGCADGALEVLDVKPDGKREMQASAWAAGLRADHLAWGRI